MNLKKVREAKGWTQAQLADASGIAASQISNYECGERGVSMNNLIKIKLALGCEWKELLD